MAIVATDALGIQQREHEELVQVRRENVTSARDRIFSTAEHFGSLQEALRC